MLVDSFFINYHFFMLKDVFSKNNVYFCALISLKVKNET